MQLRSVSVRNIRSYEAATLELGPGTTLLIGDVGAGKTSLLYAVEMALFGFAEVDATYLIRHQAPGAEVALTLADGEHLYELRRRFRRRTVRGRDVFQLDSSAYSEDGATRTYSATELRRRTIELLGFPDNPNPRAHSDLWRWAVYIPQEKMREVLEQTPSERLETVRKALGLEQYRTAAENAQLVARELTQRAERLASAASELAHFPLEIERWSAEAQRAREALGAARLAESEMREALERAEAELHRRESERTRSEAAVAEAAELARRAESARATLERGRTHHAELTASLEAVRRELDRREAAARELHDAETALAPCQESVARARAELEELTARRASLEAARRTESERREALSRLLADRAREEAERKAREAELTELLKVGPTREPPAPTPRGLAEIAEELDRSQSDADAARDRLARAELLERELEEILREGRCPRCHQSVRPDEFGPHRSEAADEVRRARSTLDESLSRRGRLDEERRARERYERAHQSWRHAEERRASGRERLGEARGRVEDLTERVTAATASLAAAEAQRKTLEPIASRGEEAAERAREAERSLVAATDRRLTALTNRERLAGREEEQRRLAGEVERLTSDLLDREREVNELNERRRAAEALVQGLEGSLAAAQAADRERRRLVSELEGFHQRLGAAARTEEHALDQLRVAREGAERRQRLDADAAHLRALGQWLGRTFRETLVRLEQRLLSRAQADFERTFSRYFHSLVDDPALLARCDSAFSPAVEINGEWTPAEALSGGERTALALAYRLALGHVVRDFGQLKLSTLILDEPTDGFSPEQVVRMGELLGELALPQVLLVSHEGGLAAVADRVVRVRKEGGTSRLLTDSMPLVAAPTPDPSARPGSEPPARRSRSRRARLDETTTPPAS